MGHSPAMSGAAFTAKRLRFVLEISQKDAKHRISPGCVCFFLNLMLLERCDISKPDCASSVVFQSAVGKMKTKATNSEISKKPFALSLGMSRMRQGWAQI